MMLASEYLQLTKPRVVALLVFCAVIGMFLAVPGIPPWRALVFGTLGIWLASGSAAAFNHLIDVRSPPASSMQGRYWCSRWCWASCRWWCLPPR